MAPDLKVVYSVNRPVGYKFFRLGILIVAAAAIGVGNLGLFCWVIFQALKEVDRSDVCLKVMHLNNLYR
jgi:hypothetical protein